MSDTKSAAAIAELQKVFNRLSPEARDNLARAGVTIPQGDISALSTGKYKFGLRCTKCNKVALYFVGTEWELRGEKHEMPPPMPHYEIAWTQHLPPSEIDRHEPRCQHCGVVLPRQQSGAFDYGNQLLNSDSATGRSKLVLVEEFESSRDKAFDRSYVQKFRRERDKGPGSVDAAGISHDYVQKPKPASEVIDEKFGEGTADRLEQVAQSTGVAEYVPKRG
jgi:hypothetical protein